MRKWMFPLCGVIALAFGASAVPVPVPVDLTGAGGFVLKGTYYPGEGEGPAVLLLHQCNKDRSAYGELARSLAAAGVHALTVDFRGFGESVTDEIPDFESRSEDLWPLFEEDVDAAYEWLLSREGVDGARVGILGASCGGSQALLQAIKRPSIRSVAFLSSSVPWIDDDTIHEFEKGRAIPLLLIASEEDRGTYQRTERLFKSSRGAGTKMILYKGNAHGAPLFDHDPALIPAITAWFVQTLR
ncbi:MAG: alpha/beta fold hydrolase [Candidatus Eisenbacteria bacterium]